MNMDLKKLALIRVFQDIQNQGNACSKQVEKNLTLEEDTENGRIGQKIELHEKALKRRTKLGNLKSTKLKRDEEYRKMVTVEQKATDKLDKKLQNSLTIYREWKATRDNLQREKLNSLIISENVNRFVEYLGLGFGAEDSNSKEGVISLYFTKVHPVDINRKYYIYFTTLRLKDGICEVSTVSPEFKGFESMKKEMNGSSIIEVIALCRERWRKDINESDTVSNS